MPKWFKHINNWPDFLEATDVNRVVMEYDGVDPQVLTIYLYHGYEIATIEVSGNQGVLAEVIHVD